MATEGATDAFWYSPGPARSRSLKTKRTRRHLKHHGIEPESCPAFKIVACGSLFPGDSQHPVPGCNGVPEHWRYGHREAPARPRHRCRPRPKRRRESHVSDSNTNAHSEGGCKRRRHHQQADPAGAGRRLPGSPAERYPPGRPGVRGVEGGAGDLLADALTAAASAITKRNRRNSGYASQTRGTWDQGEHDQQKRAAGTVQAQREAYQGGDRRPRQGDRASRACHDAGEAKAAWEEWRRSAADGPQGSAAVSLEPRVP